jgi:Flp pilus assembly protein TadG
MSLLARRRQRRERERGQALVEFALVSIVFFLVTFGIIDMARMFQSWVTVQHAAREGARYGITGRSTCTGAANRTDCIEWTAKRATAGLLNGGPSASDADVAVTFRAWDWVSNNWTGPTNNQVGKACDQLEVRVTYTHHLIVPMISIFAPSGITIAGVQRMTNEPYGPCVSGDGVS